MYHISFDLEFRKNPYKGKLIVIEGIDGSGKTTQSKRLVKLLVGKGIKSIYTKEPTDEVTGRLIRDILSGKVNVPPVAFQYLFTADRAVHQIKLGEYLKKGLTVVSDRYFWSSTVYGMVDRGISTRTSEKERLLVALSILSMYHRFIVPDLSFYLKVSPNTAMKRVIKMKKKLETYEEQEKLKKIKLGYDWLAQKFPKEITVVDGERSFEEVTKNIISNFKFQIYNKYGFRAEETA